MRLAAAFALVALVGCALAAPVAEGDAQLVIALSQRNIGAVKDLLHRVSHPASANYGRHATLDDIARVNGVSDKDFALLKAWLEDFGVRDVRLSRSRDFAFAVAENRLAQAVAQGLRAATTHGAVSSLVEAVAVQGPRDDVRVEALRPSAKWSRVAASAAGDPNTQRKSYRVPDGLKGTNSTNWQMVWGTGTFGFASSDLSAFYADYKVDNQLSLLQHAGEDGTAGGDNFGEGTLDVTYISSIGEGVRTVASNTDNSSSTEWSQGFGTALLAFAASLADTDAVPPVLSMSLGSLSWDSCDMLCRQAIAILGSASTYDDCIKYMQSQRQVCMYADASLMDRINDEFAKLGARGVTLLAATGDGGSHYSFQPFDDKTDLGKALNKVSCQFNFPTFPASSPYVLGVGGTQWTGTTPDQPHGWYASGGSFDWRFPQPEYQSAAVASYLKNTKGLPPASSFNASMRAYPDVAALANDVPMVFGGRKISAGGTSAAAPAFAGLVSLINDHRLNNGLKPLGFLNPRLYAAALAHPGELFYDVTVGNTNCASDNSCCDNGFPAAAGWDPVTGLGSPLFDGLLKYLGSD